MSIKFITGNKHKLEEMGEILAPIKVTQDNVDLDEIQELDPRKIIEHKLAVAFKHQKGNFFVEDTSAYFDAFKNKLPGPFIKWFIDSIGPLGLYEIAKNFRNNKASMQTIIAYAKSKSEIRFFTGTTMGTIVKPRLGSGFGMDPIFQPKGSQKTLSELKALGKLQQSSRYKAAVKLKKYLQTHGN